MSEPFYPCTPIQRLFRNKIVVGIAVVLTAGIVYVGYQFMQYRALGGKPAANAPMQVAIGNPNNYAQLIAGETILLNAIAVGPINFDSMELWVDGELAGVQAAPSGGQTPFKAFFSWFPAEPGAHSLVAVAINAGEEKVISTQVIVLVTAEEGAGEGLALLAADIPAVLPPAGGGGYSPPSPPGDDDSVGPADEWGGSPGDLINSYNADEIPFAPELVASTEQCGATLSIHDLSDNEEGFAVYRQMPGDPAWQEIAALSSQSQNDWLTYVDNGVVGGIIFYVSAFNSQGEAASNLVLVNVNPDDCPTPSEKLPVLTLDVLKLFPDVTSDMAYCYKSTDGVNWSRWPLVGFFTPDEDGAIPVGRVDQIALIGFDGEPALQPFDLQMECWGWQAETLVFLGDFMLDNIDPQVSSSQYAIGQGISAQVVVNSNDQYGEAEIFPMGGDLGSDFVLTQEHFLQLLAHPEIPYVTLYNTNDVDTCGDHLPPGKQNVFGQLFYCFPYPEYDMNLGASRSQSYLVWIVESYCLGNNYENCKAYAELLALAEENNGQVGFDLTVTSDLGTWHWAVTEPDLTMFVAPPLTCTGDMSYSVRLWYRPGSMGSKFRQEGSDLPQFRVGSKTLYGPISNWVSIPCWIPPAVVVEEPIQYIDVTFNSLEMDDLDDGDDSSVEVYGYLRVIAPAMGHLELSSLLYGHTDMVLLGHRRYLNLATWNEQGDGCHDESFTLYGVEFTSDQKVNGCPQWLADKVYDLKDLYFCHSSAKKTCRLSGFEFNNNTIRVFVKEGDALGVEIKLVDWDDGTANDLVCQGAFLSPARSLEQWANIQNETFSIGTSTTDSGQCTLQFTFNAVP